MDSPRDALESLVAVLWGQWHWHRSYVFGNAAPMDHHQHADELLRAIERAERAGVIPVRYAFGRAAAPRNIAGPREPGEYFAFELPDEAQRRAVFDVARAFGLSIVVDDPSMPSRFTVHPTSETSSREFEQLCGAAFRARRVPFSTEVRDV